MLRGREEISAHYDRMWETWAGFSWKPKEVAEIGDGRYALLVRIDGRAVFEPGRAAQLQG